MLPRSPMQPSCWKVNQNGPRLSPVKAEHSPNHLASRGECAGNTKIYSMICGWRSLERPTHNRIDFHMPIGSYASVPFLVQHMIEAAPRRVLDLGIGFGGNGLLVRQWIDLGAQPWKTFLAGVEVWADYRNPTWDLYDLVIVDTIENYFERYAEPFDLVLFTEVIEHFDKKHGCQVAKLAKQLVAPAGYLLVTTPVAFFEQGPEYGNEYERHLSVWTDRDLKELGFE